MRIYDITCDSSVASVICMFYVCHIVRNLLCQRRIIEHGYVKCKYYIMQFTFYSLLGIYCIKITLELKYHLCFNGYGCKVCVSVV